jgi:membrane protein required for colicin V production
MNYLDIIIIVIAVISAISGFQKGLILSLASFAGLVLGIYTSVMFASWGENILANFLHIDHKYLYIISFILIFAIVSGLVYGLGKMLESIADFTALGLVNKLGGALLGIVKAAFIIALIIFLIEVFDRNEKWISKQTKDNSLFYRPIEEKISDYIPDFGDIKEEIKEPAII